MAEIGQHPDGGGGTHPATFDDVLFSELRTANDHACPGGDAAGLGDGDLDGITGRQVAPWRCLRVRPACRASTRVNGPRVSFAGTRGCRDMRLRMHHVQRVGKPAC